MIVSFKDRQTAAVADGTVRKGFLWNWFGAHNSSWLFWTP